MIRRTKIVATLGPASDAPATLEALLRAGVDVIRLNLSHGSVDEHLERLASVRAIAADIGRPVAVLADLPGPKIRAGGFPEGGVDLVPGTSVRFVPGTAPSTAAVISVDYPTLLHDVDAGDRIVLGDGGISLRVVERDDVAVTAEVESGGRMQGRPGVHMSCERLQMFAPTAQDLELAGRGHGGRRRVRGAVVRAPRRRCRRPARRDRRPGAASSPRSRPPRRSASWRRSPTSPTR